VELTIVGCGTVVPHPEHVCSCYYVETGPVRLVLDCGPGAVHHMARFGVPWSRITHIAISHFHTDHVGDLPILLFALKWGLAEPRTEPLVLFGPPGTRDFLRDISSGFGSYILDPGLPLLIHELGHGNEASLEGAATLSAHRTPHTERSLAYRLEAADGSFGYSGDTGFDAALSRWFRGVHTLLVECSLPDDQGIDMHLTPSSAARMAGLAQPRQLLLTHIYPQLERAGLPELIRRAGWTGELEVVEDGRRFTVGPGAGATPGRT
jgi:ribonuclease BN (tRNA processing enzyme)